MGGQGVTLHWADVTYDPQSLTAMGGAVTALSGPFLTHSIILLVWLSGARSVVALAFGIGVCTRNLVLLPFTVKALMGRDVSGFSGDEMRAAEALGISPLPFALVGVGLGVIGWAVFLRRAYLRGRWVLPVALCVGAFLGIAVWSFVGPLMLPGGRGYG